MTENERRKFLKAAGASLAGAVGVGVLSTVSCSSLADTTEIRNPTREELAERLHKLAESSPPKDLSYGAMCYDIAGEPIPIEKLCPECGQTMRVGEKDEILREYNVPLKRIQDQGVAAKLILPEHCLTCGSGLTKEKFQLEIKYPDQAEPVRVELNKPNDLELMALFLQGKDRYEGMQGEEYPLKNEVERLRKLFGITAQNKE